MKEKIKYTPQGFSYVDVMIGDILRWGGLGICSGCGHGPFLKMKLIYVLQDTYCPNCFNEWLERCKSYPREDIEFDLNIQATYHLNWYMKHGVI